MEIYPSADITHHGQRPQVPGAPIAEVLPASPADDAGFYPGCVITHVNGRPLTDILLWQWESADAEVDLRYVDGEGDTGEITLERDPEEPWGFIFDGNIFDGVRLCKNNCTFCFMRQLPRGMRSSLSLRDDDFRLSFLQGTFVTLTNITRADEARIIEERISPLRVSLHAVDAATRRRMIGRHAARGLEVLEHLLEAGIQCYAQIVLCPGENDGEVLRETLTWAYERPGILEVGIVPLGYTSFQGRFDESFDEAEAAAAVLDMVRPFQERALAERGSAWVFCADEFYCNAHGRELPDALPDTGFYGECSMYEDGIGIVRSYLDSWNAAIASGQMQRLADRLRSGTDLPVLVYGHSVKDFAPGVLAASPLAGLVELMFVQNRYFGGNVDVTGLLCGCDVCEDIAAFAAPDGRNPVFYLSEVMFNDDDVTLDGMTLAQMVQRSGARIRVVSCSPEEFLDEIEQDLT